jgi:diacylglycerol kinase (ATP)
MRWQVVVNPAAGRGRTARALPRLRRLFADHGATRVHVAESLPDAVAVGREAAAAGCGLVACGGDGTVAALAGVAAETGVELAIVPTGAGNDFARSLGIRRPHDAVLLLEDGAGRARLDLGRAGPCWFTSVANAGFDAAANRWANGARRLRGTPLYLAAMARTLFVHRPGRFRLLLDETEPWELRAWLVAVGNTSTYAGGMRIAPSADPADGRLDLTVVDGSGTRAQLVANLPRVFRGTHVHHPLVHQARARRVRIEAPDDPDADLWAAGERVGPLPVTVEVVPRAVVVRVPPGGGPAHRPDGTGLSGR